MVTVAILPMTLAVLGTGMVIWPYISQEARHGGINLVLMGVGALVGAMFADTLTEYFTEPQKTNFVAFLELEAVIFVLSIFLSMLFVPAVGEHNLRQTDLVWIDISPTKDLAYYPPVFFSSFALANLVALPMAISKVALWKSGGDKAHALGVGVASLFAIPLLIFLTLVLVED